MPYSPSMPRFISLAALALLLAAPTPESLFGREPPPTPTEHHFAFLVQGPGGPETLQIAAIAPPGQPVEPLAFAAAVAAAIPAATPIPPPAATAAFALDQVRWREPRIPWQYNPAGAPAALEPETAHRAILAGAEGWRFAGGTPVEFLYSGQTTTPTGCAGDPATHPYTRDGANIVGWSTIPGGYLGYTCWWRGTSLVEGTPYFELLEFDIVLSPAYPYTADLLRALVLHEFGHALGLAHSDHCPGAAMCPGEGALVHLEPQPDDLAGLLALYGRTTPPADLPVRARLPHLARD